MTTSSTLSYNEALQQYADEYFEVTQKVTATTREIAEWAIATERWSPPRDLLIQKCREDFATALREQYIKNSHGKSVRAKQVARIVQNGVQQFLWGDIRKINRKHMQSAVQLKRSQMVGEARQIDRDCCFWNELNNDEQPLQMVFDLTDDVEEGRYSGEYPTKQPS